MQALAKMAESVCAALLAYTTNATFFFHTTYSKDLPDAGFSGEKCTLLSIKQKVIQRGLTVRKFCARLVSPLWTTSLNYGDVF